MMYRIEFEGASLVMPAGCLVEAYWKAIVWCLEVTGRTLRVLSVTREDDDAKG